MPRRARQLQEAAALFDELGEGWKRGQCLTELARIATEAGQYEQARTLLAESLRLYEGLADQERVAWVRYLQARLLFVSQLDRAARPAVGRLQPLALPRVGQHRVHAPIRWACWAGCS